MKITIYILKCADGTHYTGITKDIERRLNEHNKGRSQSTRDKRPVTLKHTEEVEGYKTAAMIERKIKNLGAKKYLIRARNYNSLVSSGLAQLINIESPAKSL